MSLFILKRNTEDKNDEKGGKDINSRKSETEEIPCRDIEIGFSPGFGEKVTVYHLADRQAYETLKKRLSEGRYDDIGWDSAKKFADDRIWPAAAVADPELNRFRLMYAIDFLSSSLRRIRALENGISETVEFIEQFEKNNNRKKKGRKNVNVSANKSEF